MSIVIVTLRNLNVDDYFSFVTSLQQIPERIDIMHSWQIEQGVLAGDMLNIVALGKSGDRSWQTV